MSDIAMLVAEEYERRIKNSRKSCSGGGGCCGGGATAAAAEEEEMGFVSSVSAIAVTVRAKKKVIGEEKMEIVKWVLEPKSQIGLAAFNGFFSA